MSKKLFALEELQEEAIVIAPESTDETASSEITQAALEVEEAGDQIDHAEDVASTLDNVADTLSTMAPGAVVPEPVMEALNIAISGLLGSIGMSQRQQGVAMESFSKATTAMESVDAIKETANKVWVKIKEFFARIIAYVKKLFNKIKIALSGVKTRIDDNITKSRAGNGTRKQFTPKNKSLERMGFVDKDVTVESIVKHIEAGIDSVDKNIMILGGSDLAVALFEVKSGISSSIDSEKTKSLSEDISTKAIAASDKLHGLGEDRHETHTEQSSVHGGKQTTFIQILGVYGMFVTGEGLGLHVTEEHTGGINSEVNNVEMRYSNLNKMDHSDLYRVSKKMKTSVETITKNVSDCDKELTTICEEVNRKLSNSTSGDGDLMSKENYELLTHVRKATTTVVSLQSVFLKQYLRGSTAILDFIDEAT